VTRRRVYSLLAVAVVLAAWAHLRALPRVNDARFYSRELADLPTRPPVGSPSASALLSQIEALEAERAQLEGQAADRAARAEVTGRSLQALVRDAGLTLVRVRHVASQPQPARRARRAPARLQLVASGEFSQVQRLVRALEDWDEGALVERMQLSLESDLQVPGPLRLQLEVLP